MLSILAHQVVKATHSWDVHLSRKSVLKWLQLLKLVNESHGQVHEKHEGGQDDFHDNPPQHIAHGLVNGQNALKYQNVLVCRLF